MPITLDDATALLVIRAITRLPPASGQLILAALEQQSERQAEQAMLLREISRKVGIMSQSQQDFDTEIAGLRDDVSRQTSVTNSVKVFVAGLAAKLDEALSRPDPAQAVAAVRAIHADLNANTQSLVDATTQSTPSAGEPTTNVEPTTTVDTVAVERG
jgi:hypothetical protein